MILPLELSLLVPGSGLQLLTGTCYSSPGREKREEGKEQQKKERQAGIPSRVGQAPQGMATCLEHTVMQAASQGVQGSHKRGGWGKDVGLFPTGRIGVANPGAMLRGEHQGSDLF